MMQKHAEFRQEMEDAVKLATTNKEEGFRAAEMAAVKAGSEVVKAKLRKGDLIGSYNLVNDSMEGGKWAFSVKQKHDEAEEARKFRKEQAQQAAEAKREAQKSSYEYVTKDGKTYAINKNNPKDIQEVNVDLGGATKVGAQAKGTSSSQAQFENITSADIGNAYFRVNEYLSKSKDGKIPEGSKFLRDKGTQSGVIDAYKNWMVNRSLPPDLQGNDAALLGIAFDVVAARSFGRAAGVTDSKIAQVVRQLPVEGDSESTKQGKMRMLLNQLEEPNKLLPKEKRKDGAKRREVKYPETESMHVGLYSFK
jgi:hypothetical protein